MSPMWFCAAWNSAANLNRSGCYMGQFRLEPEEGGFKEAIR
jgi:hypothetical protein